MWGVCFVTNFPPDFLFRFVFRFWDCTRTFVSLTIFVSFIGTDTKECRSIAGYCLVAGKLSKCWHLPTSESSAPMWRDSLSPIHSPTEMNWTFRSRFGSIFHLSNAFVTQKFRVSNSFVGVQSIVKIHSSISHHLTFSIHFHAYKMTWRQFFRVTLPTNSENGAFLFAANE